jgi:hypothetical protein
MNAYRLRADVKYQLNIKNEEQLKALVEALAFHKRNILSRLTDPKKYEIGTHDALFDKAYNLAELLDQLPELEQI